MIDTSRLLAFVVTSFVLIITPGPSVLFIVSRALAYGRRTALTTVLGNSAGFYVQVVAIAFGIGVVLQRSVLFFWALRLAAAGYLICLGLHAIADRSRLTAALDILAPRPHSSARAARQGFAVGVANPKTMVFLTAILPEFIDRSRATFPHSSSCSARSSCSFPWSVTAPGAWRPAPGATGSPVHLGACNGSGVREAWS